MVRLMLGGLVLVLILIIISQSVEIHQLNADVKDLKSLTVKIDSALTEHVNVQPTVIKEQAEQKVVYKTKYIKLKCKNKKYIKRRLKRVLVTYHKTMKALIEAESNLIKTQSDMIDNYKHIIETIKLEVELRDNTITALQLENKALNSQVTLLTRKCKGISVSRLEPMPNGGRIWHQKGESVGITAKEKLGIEVNTMPH